jgi:hypothetical protein
MAWRQCWEYLAGEREGELQKAMHGRVRVEREAEQSLG